MIDSTDPATTYESQPMPAPAVDAAAYGLAWHGEPVLKAAVLERMYAHRAADEIVQGIYQQISPDTANGYRGCAIGCTLPPQTPIYAAAVARGERSSAYIQAGGDGYTSDWHRAVARLYGISEPVAHLIDLIFEGLPANPALDAGTGLHRPVRMRAADFAVRSIDTIPVGANLDHVPRLLLADLLAEVAQRADGLGHASVRDVVDQAANLCSATDPDAETIARVLGDLTAQRAVGWPVHDILDAARHALFYLDSGGSDWPINAVEYAYSAGIDYADIAEKFLTLLAAAPVPADTPKDGDR